MSNFRDRVYTTLYEEFDKALKFYKEEYTDQEDQVSYLKTQKIDTNSIVLDGKISGDMISHNIYRILRLSYKIQRRQGITINNYIESWNYTLKESYLGEFRKRCTNEFANALLQKVLPNFRQKVSEPSMELNEERNLRMKSGRVRNFMHEQIKTLRIFGFSKLCLQKNEFSNGFLRSLLSEFRGDIYIYIITINTAGSICTCSCQFHSTTKAVCKKKCWSNELLNIIFVI